MTHFFRKILGFAGGDVHVEKDDFSLFFDAKSADKAKVIRQVMREASDEQREVLKKYKEKELAGASGN